MAALEEKEEATTKVVVIDNGSATMKAGLNHTDKPSSVFPTILGLPRVEGTVKEGFLVGDEAKSKRGLVVLRYPIEHGIVTNWEHMEMIWQYIFSNELKIKSEDQAVLLSDNPLTSNETRQKMAEIMFENFKVPSLHIGISEVLSLYACGKTSGMVVSSGDGHTLTVPIYEAKVISDGICPLNLGGRDLTDYLVRMLSEHGHSYYTSSERDSVREMKERLGYVALNFESARTADSSSDIERQYEMPDGNMITVSKERFRCAEPLFQPRLARKEGSGIHEMIQESITKCDEGIESALWYGNIVLSGGSTMFPGLDQRLAHEMVAIAPASTKITVVAPPERKYSVWIGGSILSSLSTFQDMCISKSEFEEHGTTIVTKKLPVSEMV